MHSNTFAARAGRWSAKHRKKAIWGWLAFVAIAFVIGGALGVKKPANQNDYIGQSGKADRGIVIGGSGQGEQMAANKVHGVRAALCNDLYTARMSREHNDANVLAMGGRIVAFGLADEIVALWLGTAFEGGRHRRRVDQITDIERIG